MRTHQKSNNKSRVHSSFAFYLLHSGFQVFKQRLSQELSARHGHELEDYVDDDMLYPYYQGGESTEYVLNRIVGASEFSTQAD